MNSPNNLPSLPRPCPGKDKPRIFKLLPVACIIHEAFEKSPKVLPVSRSGDLAEKGSVFSDVITAKVSAIDELFRLVTGLLPSPLPILRHLPRFSLGDS